VVVPIQVVVPSSAWHPNDSELVSPIPNLLGASGSLVHSALKELDSYAHDLG